MAMNIQEGAEERERIAQAFADDPADWEKYPETGWAPKQPTLKPAPTRRKRSQSPNPNRKRKRATAAVGDDK